MNKYKEMHPDEALMAIEEYSSYFVPGREMEQAFSYLIDRVKKLEHELGLHRISTHGEGCHTWGPKHYECLLRKYKDLEGKEKE